jgi:hypothetical protein
MRGIAMVCGVLAFAAACESRRPPPDRAPAAAPPVRTAAPPVARPRPAPPPKAWLSIPTTSVAWSFAETHGTAASWDAAADAYQRERAGCADDCREVAYAVVLARKNALLAEPVQPPPGDDPVAMPPRVQAVVDAIDEYVSLADPSDPELAGIRFLAASATVRWRQPDAVARLEAILREHRSAESAEYAANVLVDLLLRADRVDEAREWVDELLADVAFLADKPELQQTLERLRELIAASAR